MATFGVMVLIFLGLAFVAVGFVSSIVFTGEMFKAKTGSEARRNMGLVIVAVALVTLGAFMVASSYALDAALKG